MTEKVIHFQKRVQGQNISYSRCREVCPLKVCVCFCVQKRPMQTDGWPEVDELKHPDLINEQDLLEAKTVILNWIKDLRAQPEVGS